MRWKEAGHPDGGLRDELPFASYQHATSPNSGAGRDLRWSVGKLIECHADLSLFSMTVGARFTTERTRVGQNKRRVQREEFHHGHVSSFAGNEDGDDNAFPLVGGRAD